MIKSRIAAVTVLVLSVALVCQSPARARGSGADRRPPLRAVDAVLFGPAVDDPAALGVKQPWELRRRIVTVNGAVLHPLCRPPALGQPDTLTLDLFPDVTLVVQAQSVTRTDRRDSIRLLGTIPDEPDSQVTLTAIGLCAASHVTFSLAGSVRFGGKEFTIQPRSAGRAMISEIDTLAAGLLEKPDHTEPPVAAHAPPTPPSSAAALARDRRAPGTNSIIDVLIIFTAGAVARAGGTDNIEAWITDAVGRANDNLADSGAHVYFRVVDMQEDPAYTGGETVERAFRALNNTADGRFDSAVRLRQRYGADIVTAVVAGYDPATGIAGMASYPENPKNPATSDQIWSVVAADQLWAFVLAHEWGHLLGLNHDWRTSPDTNPYYPDNHGFVAPDNKFVTIMGYPTACHPSCPYAPYFANPDLSYRGERLGVRLGAGTQPADNARIMNITGPEVAAYRSARIRPPDKRLTIAASPGGTAAPHVLGPYDPGESVSVTAHPEPGYVLAGWTLDGKAHQADDPINVTMDTDHTLLPRFLRQAASGYRLSTVSTPAGGGDIRLSPLLDSYPHDRQVVATARPRKGYAFAGWTLDGYAAGDEPSLSIQMTGSHTLTAQFSRARTLTVNRSPGRAGTVTVSRGTHNADGIDVVAQARPAAGYIFGRWLLDGRPDGTSPVTSLTINGNQTLTAVFIARPTAKPSQPGKAATVRLGAAGNPAARQDIPARQGGGGSRSGGAGLRQLQELDGGVPVAGGGDTF